MKIKKFGRILKEALKRPRQKTIKYEKRVTILKQQLITINGAGPKISLWKLINEIGINKLNNK